jgi:hypothetical protein
MLAMLILFLKMTSDNIKFNMKMKPEKLYDYYILDSSDEAEREVITINSETQMKIY